MRKLRWTYYRRADAGVVFFGAHLAVINSTRTLCNRSTRGWQGGERPTEGRVLVCQRCLTLAGTCSVCSAPVDAHFDGRNRWVGCSHARRAMPVRA